jgi:hypothetical protein
MMNGKYGAGRGARRAGVLAVVVAAALPTAACGVHISLGADPASTAGYRANLAYAHCMRSHGVPNFPIPSPGESFHISTGGHPHGKKASTPRARANAVCEHLLPPGSVTGG